MKASASLRRKSGCDEARPLLVQLLEPLLEGREREEPVPLLLPRQFDLVDRAAVAVLDLGLGLEVGAARAIPALVGALVDVPVVVDPLHDLLDLLHVPLVCGPDEEVVGRVHFRRQLLEARRVAVAELPGLDSLALGLLGDGLPVLVGAGEEEDVLPALAVMSREDVGRDRRVGVPQMGLAVDVVDGRGDVVAHRARIRAARGLQTSPAPVSRRAARIRPGSPCRPRGSRDGDRARDRSRCPRRGRGSAV